MGETTYEEVLARHEAGDYDSPVYGDRAWLLDEVRRAATLLEGMQAELDALRERCAREADAEVRTGEHRILKAQFSDHVAIAQTMIATGTTIAKRIRELR